jgi:hypothetical protein
MASLSFPISAAILDALPSMGVTAAEFATYLERRKQRVGAITPALERLRILYLEAQHAVGYRRIPQTAYEFPITDEDRVWPE